jgi:hypothetical protein
MRAPVVLSLSASIVLLGAGCGSSPNEGPPATTASAETTTQTDPHASSSVSILASTVRVSPTRAGTPQDPQPVALNASLRLRQPAGVDPPIARAAELDLSNGTRFDGNAAPTCSLDTLKAKGAAGCPPTARLGKGTAIGLADTTKTIGTIEVFNGGPGHLYLATVVRNPAYVKSVVIGDVTGDSRTGLRLRFTFPHDLQNIAGVPLGLQRLDLALDATPVLTTTACPAGKWTYQSSVTFADGTAASRAGAVPCH